MKKIETVITKQHIGYILLDTFLEIEDIIEEFIIGYNGVKTGYREMFIKMCTYINGFKSFNFNDEAFLNLYYFMNRTVSDRGMNGFINFFKFLVKMGYGDFNLISQELLGFKDLISKLNDNFEIVKYDPYLKPPAYSKMLIDFSGHTNLNHHGKAIYILNLSDYKNRRVRELLTYFIWNYNEDLTSKQLKDHYLLQFIKILDEEEYEEKIEIKLHHITKYKKSVLATLKKSSSGVAMSRVRQFINFLASSDLIKIKEQTRAHLKVFATKSIGDLRKYSYEEINKIIDELEALYFSTRHKKYLLMRYIVQIQLLTPLRLREILSLEVNSLQEIAKNIYVINTNTKTEKNARVNTHISVANIIKQAIEATRDERLQTNSIMLMKSIFIFKKEKGVDFTNIKQKEVSDTINMISKRLGFMQLGQTGIRNHFASKITEFALKNGGDKEMISQLSRHSIQTHMNYYDSNKHIAMFGDFYNVEIGNIELAGSVQNNYVSNEEDVVEFGCGFCVASNCNNTTPFDCFLCNNFVTTVDNIPLFEKEIEIIDKRIIDEEIDHEKEFLISKKKLLVKYLFELERLKS